jgi:hypothetical protein
MLPTILADRRLLRAVVIRVFLAWTALSVGLLVTGPVVFEALRPLFKFTFDLMQPDLDASLRVSQASGHWAVEMQPLVIHPIPLTRDRSLSSGALLGWWSTDLSHNLLPLLIYLSAVIAWPAGGNSERLGRLVVSVPVVLLLLALSAPLVLAGQVEISILREAARWGAARHEPGLVTFLIFMESGGRWLLPLAAAVACVVGVRRVVRRAALPPTPAAFSANDEPPVFPPV